MIWADVLNYCLGEVGLTPREFWSMTWEEVNAACRGYEVREARRKELERFMAAVMLNTNRRKGAKAVRPEEIMPLVTDRQNEVEIMTDEEIVKMRELFNNVKWQA